MLLQLQCCGGSGPSDWAGSNYNNPQTERINSLRLAISSPEQSYKIPASCCLPSADDKQCKDAQIAVASGPISKLIFSKV